MSRYYFPIQKGKQLITNYSGIISIGERAFYHKGNLWGKHIIFPDLEQINGTSAFQCAFQYSTEIERVDFPKLKVISGSSAFNSAFGGCPKLKIVNFPVLETFTGTNSSNYVFSSCSSLESISFPSLTTFKTGFNMFSNCSSLREVHFRTELEEQLKNKAGYMGVSSDVLIFDL